MVNLCIPVVLSESQISGVLHFLFLVYSLFNANSVLINIHLQ